ncbi:MAG: MarR family transcriptional regulator [Pseudomonadota bacterium]
MESDAFRLSAFMPYRLAVLAERVSRRLSVEYGRTKGLTVAEWRVLVHLQRGGRISVREIHNHVNLEKPRVSRAVGRLERAGLVEKTSSEGDGRLVAISLTMAGLKVLSEVLPAATAFEARLLEGLRADELTTFLSVLEKIHEVLDTDPDAKPRAPMDLQDVPGMSD